MQSAEACHTCFENYSDLIRTKTRCHVDRGLPNGLDPTVPEDPAESTGTRPAGAR